MFLDTPYYVYPDGELAAEAFQVISEAMAAKGLVGIGRVTISSRERLVLEPHDGCGCRSDFPQEAPFEYSPGVMPGLPGRAPGDLERRHQRI